jgi:hypothetical protein
MTAKAIGTTKQKMIIKRSVKSISPIWYIPTSDAMIDAGPV